MVPIMSNSRVEQHQRQQRADAGRRQGRQDRDRVNVALVEHAEQDVDRRNGGDDQDRLVVERLRKHLRGAGEAAVDRNRHMDLVDRFVDLGRRFAERRALLQIERNGGGDEQALVIDRERRIARLIMRHGGERDHGLLGGGDRGAGRRAALAGRGQ